jgi:hypothetical protein
MDEFTVHHETRSGDGFYAAAQKQQAQLEEKLRHEMMDDERRQELRDQVLRLRRRFSKER